ncbi:MAG TPA: hypothetical protein VLC95_09180 [Anaerolineae bacterium]|nr:hypothetical protein [Anaerolineae bacterium]
MEDLLGALMQGAEQPDSEDEGADVDPLAQLLQGFLSGQAPQDADAQAAPASPDVPDLASLMQGFGSTGATGQIPREHLSRPEPGATQDAPDLGGLLQTVLGGAGGAGPAPSGGAGGLGDILGAILGSGSSAMSSNSLLAPIVDKLAEKLGLPPQVAQAVVAFVLGKLLQSRAQSEVATRQASATSRAARPGAAALDDVVTRMNSGKSVPRTAVRRSGMARELARHTGLDRATAEAGVQEVLNALGSQIGGR